jgi:hypothetical protein
VPPHHHGLSGSVLIRRRSLPFARVPVRAV